MARARRSKEIPLLEKQFEEEHVKGREFWEQEELERVCISTLMFVPYNLVCPNLLTLLKLSLFKPQENCNRGQLIKTLLAYRHR